MLTVLIATDPVSLHAGLWFVHTVLLLLRSMCSHCDTHKHRDGINRVLSLLYILINQSCNNLLPFCFNYLLWLLESFPLLVLSWKTTCLFCNKRNIGNNQVPNVLLKCIDYCVFCCLVESLYNVLCFHQTNTSHRKELCTHRL